MDAVGLSDFAIAGTLEKRGYRLMERIGAGAYGSVYRVYSEKWKEDFVCKIQKLPEESKSRSTEDQTLMKLDHPNIIALYEQFEVGGFLFMILEYCPGGTLQQVIGPSGLPKDKLIDYALQLTSAVRACHNVGIAHRDIKPANVLIDRHGRLKLTDFGLANDTGSNDKAPAFAGSRAYMAPELFQMRQTDLFQCDIWALGVTFFVMANGTLPWDSSSLYEMERAIRSGLLPGGAYVSKEFTQMVKQMLQQNPAKRLNLMTVQEILLTEKHKLACEGIAIGQAGSAKSGFLTTRHDSSSVVWSVRPILHRKMAGVRTAMVRRLSATPILTFKK